MNKNSLAKNTVFSVLYQFISLIFPLIYSVYVGRILLAEGVGHVAFANNVVSYFILFATLGLSSYGTREVAKVQNNQNKKNVLFTELFGVN